MFSKDPPPLYKLAFLAMELKENDWRQEDGSKEELAKKVSKLLSCKAEMLDDYFSFQINPEGHLKGIPLLLGTFYASYTSHIDL